MEMTGEQPERQEARQRLTRKPWLVDFDLIIEEVPRKLKFILGWVGEWIQ